MTVYLSVVFFDGEPSIDDEIELEAALNVTDDDVVQIPGCKFAFSRVVVPYARKV